MLNVKLIRNKKTSIASLFSFRHKNRKKKYKQILSDIVKHIQPPHHLWLPFLDIVPQFSSGVCLNWMLYLFIQLTHFNVKTNEYAEFYAFKFCTNSK